MQDLTKAHQSVAFSKCFLTAIGIFVAHAKIFDPPMCLILHYNS